MRGASGEGAVDVLSVDLVLREVRAKRPFSTGVGYLPTTMICSDTVANKDARTITNRASARVTDPSGLTSKRGECDALCRACDKRGGGTLIFIPASRLGLNLQSFSRAASGPLHFRLDFETLPSHVAQPTCRPLIAWHAKGKQLI